MILVISVLVGFAVFVIVGVLLWAALVNRDDEVLPQ